MARPGQGGLEQVLASYHQLLLSATAGQRWLLRRASGLQLLLVWETEGFLG